MFARLVRWIDPSKRRSNRCCLRRDDRSRSVAASSRFLAVAVPAKTPQHLVIPGSGRVRHAWRPGAMHRQRFTEQLLQLQMKNDLAVRSGDRWPVPCLELPVGRLGPGPRCARCSLCRGVVPLRCLHRTRSVRSSRHPHIQSSDSLRGVELVAAES